MHKVLISNPHIGSYSALLLLALFGGYLLTRWRAQRLGIRGSHIDNMMLCVAVMSLIGARFFSWWFYFPPGSDFWSAMFSTGGGMVFYGGLIFGIGTVLAYGHFAKLVMGNLLDACAPGVALGLALGRIGCFMAGCCWGDLAVSDTVAAKLPSSDLAWQVRTFPILSGANVPFAVTFPPEASAWRQHHELGLIPHTAPQSLPVHPVQLYETVLALLLCWMLHRQFRHRKWQGEIAVNLSIGYAAIRFLTEFFRGDNSPIYFGLTLSQVISILIALSAMGCIAWRRRDHRPGHAIRVPITAAPERR